MKASDYRREFSAHASARERAAYEFYSGRAARLDPAPVRDRYADLWTREAVADLLRERDETPTSFETGRAALSALAGSARLGYAETRAREASEELARCESAARAEWEGRRLAPDEAPALIAAERDAARRRELSARWLDALRACDDLRAARLEALRDAARELDFEDFGALSSEATRTDAEWLAAQSELFLARTARPYAERLARWAALRLPPQLSRVPDSADSFFLARLPHLDEFFPAREAAGAFESLMSDLGIRAGRRGVSSAEECERVGEGRALCFATRPPEEVRVVASPRAGADFYLRLFGACARARQLAWVSPDLAARYPEFVRAADRATSEGFAFLFRQLFSDPVWIGRQLAVAAHAAREIAAACALVALHEARRACALALAQRELYVAAGARSEALDETYSARLAEATGFRAPTARRLWDATGCGGRAAEDVRALLFAAALGEHLRTRHGVRWWAARAAGDELIDVWNTGSRHAAEELAPLLGAPRPDAELLAESLTAAPSGE